MIKKMTVSIMLVILLANGYGQEKHYLTQKEVLKYWRFPSWQKPTDSLVVDASPAYNLRLNNFIDSLSLNNVDSVIVFSTVYVGYISNDACDLGSSPVTSFVIWNKGGKTSVRMIRGSCPAEVARVPSVNLFSFYGGNQTEMRSEFFMPVVFNATLNKYNKMDYMMSMAEHEPNYSFFYKIGKDSRCFRFSESYLEDRQSMFLDYNLALKAYAWWKMVKKEVGE